MNRYVLVLVLAAFLASPQAAQTQGGPAAKADVTPADQAAVAKALLPSMVQVDWWLQFDKGEAPRASGWGKRCPNCGAFHGIGAERCVEEERPLHFNGYLLAPTRVMAPDVGIHPRFIKRIEVRFGDQRVPAKPVAWAVDQDAVFLELQEPLKGAKPLEFKPQMGPYLAASYDFLNGAWSLTVEPASPKVTVLSGGETFLTMGSNCVVTTKEGAPVTVLMRADLPLDDSWKTSPLTWKTLGADEMAKALADLEQKTSQSLLHVVLSFRSPKKTAGGMRFSRSGGEEEATELHAVGVLVADTKVLVLANLRGKVTARLEKVVVRPPAGDPVPAEFAGSLTDYGALVATLKKPLAGALPLAAGNIRTYRKTLLLGADVCLQGEKRIAYFEHRRIAGFMEGWREMLFPEMPGRGDHVFLFTREGALVSLPVVRRPKVSTEREYDYDRAAFTPAAYLKTVLDDLAKNVDKNNIPLSEAEENRLAWTGLELQGLTPELAKANGVSDQSNDGRYGAIVSYVYPDSPAAKGGIEVGDILLRLHAEGQAKPIDLRVEEDRYGGNFPWERLDEVAEQYYDRIPPPWPSADNAANRTLTEIGFGKKFTVEYVHGGAVLKKEFEVVVGPAHYDSAPRYKAELIGLTVRDMTYEVRRYLQRKPDEPGVIVARLEPGSKASVAGLKPYETVTHVNDKPVMSVKDFEQSIAGQTELRLSVKRMAQGRVVKINLAAAEEKPGPGKKSTAPGATKEPGEAPPAKKPAKAPTEE